MGLISNYYLNGTTLTTSTNIYSDAALTTPAPDGFYSQNGFYREAVAGVLGTTQACPSCISSCPLNISTLMSSTGLYSVEVEINATVGAVIITFDPRSTPYAIRATYNNTVYNAISSPVDGYHKATSSTNPTYIGNGSDPCASTLVSNSPYGAVTEYNWYDTAFYDTGNTSSVVVSAGDASFTTGANPGSCVMVIPKITTPSANLLIEVVEPASCTGLASLNVACPVTLSSFLGSDVGAVCGAGISNTYYNVPVTGTVGAPALYDWVFLDENAEDALPDGDYIFADGSNGTPHTITNGIITNVGTPCP